MSTAWNARRLAALIAWPALAGCHHDPELPPLAAVDLGAAAVDLAAPRDLLPPPDLVRTHDLVLLPGYPADHAPLPQAVSSGGPVLASPELMAVTWQGDTMAASLTEFVAKVGTTGWWRAVATEYGVGAPTVRPAVQLPNRPASVIGDSDIQALLADRLDGTHPEFGRGSAQSLFVLFFPARVSIDADFGRSCVDFAAYHSDFVLDSGTPVAYAVVPRCQATLDDLTVSASHEIIEAATDPRPIDLPAFQRTNLAGRGFERIFHGGEVGDLCQFETTAWLRAPELGRLVQRSWSNAAARASQDPCVPASVNDYYFNSAVVVPDAGGLLELQVGVPRQLELDLFSTGPLPEWTLAAGNSPSLDSSYDFAFSRASGKNGDRVTLTVTLTSAGSHSPNEGFTVTSTLGFVSHLWPVGVQVK